MKTSSRNICLLSILLLYSVLGYTQNDYINSLRNKLQTQKEDTNKIKMLIEAGQYYVGFSPDTSIRYARQAIDLGEKINFAYGVLEAERVLVFSLTTLGNYPLAMEAGFKSYALAKKLGDPFEMIFATSNLAECYYYLGDYNTCLQYDREIVKIVEATHPDSIAFICAGISRVFQAMNQPDSAIWYAKKSYETVKSWNFLDEFVVIYPVVGGAYAGKGYYDSALFFYRQGIPGSIKSNWVTNLIDIYNGMAELYKAIGNLDSALWYAKKVLDQEIGKSYASGSLKAVNMLASIYQSKNKPDSSLKYLQIAIGLKDSLFNRDKTIAIQNLAYKEQEKQKEIAAARLTLQSQYRTYFFLAALIVFLVIAAILLKNKRQKQLQNMRNSIADDLHDDIGSTLSSISIMSELAKKKSPDALSLLSSIGESTMTMQENMSDIIWTVNPKNDRFENVLLRMNQFASEMLNAKNIELDFINDESLVASRLTMDQRKNFYLFFKEAINNAAKYSDAKKVCVRVSQKSHYIEMTIGDNGKGFDTAKISDGNGMNTLKRRAEELAADFNIQSHIQEGTVVQLKFKIA